MQDDYHVFSNLCSLNGSQRSCSAEILILRSDCFYKALQKVVVLHRKYFHFHNSPTPVPFPQLIKLLLNVYKTKAI